MNTVAKAAPEKEERASDYTEKIKSEVLAKIGRPPRLVRVEVSRQHGKKYRVNIWQQPEPNPDLAVSLNPRIGLSYYLTVSDMGEIIDSNPPLTKLASSA